MKKFVAVVSVIASFMFSAASVRAEDHSISTIQGTQVDLKVYDHAIAGQIRDFVVFGALDESTGMSELTMKRDGQLVRASFGRDPSTGKFGGLIRHEDQGKQLHETKLQFVKLDKTKNIFTFLVNDQQVEVRVTFDAFANNHYLNPTYRTEVDGKALEFTLKG
ncbi:MAG: hypothetical protein KGQ59_12325, partial [Bdellovibrionales bacterium]|nr:hypothetical protein [Bdellovibrionales bacterium]